MKKKALFSIFMALTFAGILWASSALAGPPLTNVEGVGGVALNPMAYVANPVKDGGSGLLGNGVVSKPQLGIWNVGLTETDINWTAMGGNISFYNRVELGYSHEFVDVQGVQNIDKDNISLKVNLVKEGDFGVDLMPAISAGLIYKDTQFDKASLRDHTGVDYYLVATKMIPGLPVPVILNAGVLSTKGYVRGVLGFGNHRDLAFFGNIETILFKKFIVGWEYEQDADVGKVVHGSNAKFGTHSMWEAHVAYMYDDNLMLVVSGAYTGDKNSVGPFEEGQAAFGGAYVLSLQYAF